MREKRLREKSSSPAVLMLAGESSRASLGAAESAGEMTSEDGNAGESCCGDDDDDVVYGVLTVLTSDCGPSVDGDCRAMEMVDTDMEMGETGGMRGSGEVDMVANGRLREEGPEEALGKGPSLLGGGWFPSAGEEMT